jgi:hypothetical protein
MTQDPGYVGPLWNAEALGRAINLGTDLSGTSRLLCEPIPSRPGRFRVGVILRVNGQEWESSFVIDAETAPLLVSLIQQQCGGDNG